MFLASSFISCEQNQYISYDWLICHVTKNTVEMIRRERRERTIVFFSYDVGILQLEWYQHMKFRFSIKFDQRGIEYGESESNVSFRRKSCFTAACKIYYLVFSLGFFENS